VTRRAELRRAAVVVEGDAASGAAFDATRRYRYLLWRRWRARGRSVVLVMLNPSTADATKNDATIRRCIGFAQCWGFAAMTAVNLFAWRATHPKDLRRAVEPVGPLNDEVIRDAAGRADRVVAAWGAHGDLLGRGDAVLASLRDVGPVHAFGRTGTGQPAHPLRLARTTKTRRIV